LNQNKDADKPSVVVAGKVVGGWVVLCWDWRGGGWLFVAEKYGQGRSRNERGREEGQASDHKLNITERIILIVTLSTILSVKISRHRTICFLESFSSGYSWMNFTIELILYVTSSVKLTHHHIVWLFYFFFHCDFLGKYC